MMSAPRRAVVLWIVAGAAIEACAVEPKPVSGQELARVPVARPPPEAALLALTVDAVINPTGQPLVLRSVLRSADESGRQSAEIDLGQIALHPNDQPATFLIRVPAVWISEARLHKRSSLLVVSIVRAPGEPATDARADVRAVWMREPK